MAQSAQRLGHLLDRAIQTAWHYRGLWLLGIFAGYGMNFNLKAPSGEPIAGTVGPLTTSLPFPSVWTVVYLLALFFLCYTIAVPALVSAINSLNRTGSYRFGESVLIGVDVFFPILGLSLSGVVLLVLSASLLAALAVMLFAISTILGVVSLIVIVPAGLLLIFLYASLVNLSIRDITIRRARLLDSLQTSWRFVRRHTRRTFGVFLISVGFVAAAFVALRFCFHLVQLVASLFSAEAGESLPTLYAVLFGLPFSIIVGGFFGVCAEGLYTFYYLSVEEPSRDDIWATTGARDKHKD